MRQLFLYTFLMFLMGCAWELPDRKDAQSCTIKPSVKIDKTAGNKLAFTVSLTSITEVITASYTITGPSSPTVTTPSGGSFTSQVTVTVGGNYNIEAKITDKCGKTYSVTGSVSTDGCVAPKSDLTVNPSQTDPKLTTFTLENATDVKTLVWKVNGTAVTNTNSNTVILSYSFERGKTYEVIAEYTDNCGTKGTSKGTYTSTGCNAPTTVTVVQPSTSSVELTAKLEGGVLSDIDGTVNWKISPAGTIKASTNSEVTFQGLNPDSPYTITAEFKTTCQTPGTVSGTGRTAQAVVTTKNAWSIKGGGPLDGVNDMVLDDAGNIYVLGSFQSADLDFGNGKTLVNNNRKRELFVAKFNTQGVCQWASSCGSPEDDEAAKMCLDKNYNIYIIGTLKGAGSFGSVSTAYYGSSDAFVAKLDRDIGRWVWANTLGGGDTDFGRGIAYSSFNDQIYITGTVVGNGNTVIKRNNNTNSDNYTVSAYDMFFGWCNVGTGALNSPSVIGGLGFQEPSSIAVDASGNAYFTGKFTEQFTFGSPNLKLTSSGSFDIFVAKWIVTGTVGWNWAKKTGGTGADEATGICIDGSQNIYITGQHNGTILDYNIGSTGDFNVLWASYNNSGTLRWIQNGGNDGKEDRGFDISLSDDGNLVICGIFQSTGAFPFNSTKVLSNGSGDFYAFRASTSNGSLVGAINAGGGSGNDGAGAAVYKNGKMYVAGSFQGSATISGTALSAPSQSVSNVFVAKF